VRAYADARALAALDALNVRALDERVRGLVPIVRVAELATNVVDLRGLDGIAETLMLGGV
jgi:hypothetical protein